MCFSRPKLPDMPKPPEPPPQPKEVDERIRSARASEKKRQQAAAGRGSTILSEGLLAGDDSNTQKITLGG